MLFFWGKKKRRGWGKKERLGWNQIIESLECQTAKTGFYFFFLGGRIVKTL